MHLRCHLGQLHVHRLLLGPFVYCDCCRGNKRNFAWAAKCRAEEQMRLVSELSGVTLASIDDDALLLRLTTAERTAPGKLHNLWLPNRSLVHCCTSSDALQ